MMMTMAFPLAQSTRFTICCRIVLMSAVCCATPRAPTVDQAGTFGHDTAPVRDRDEMFPELVPNAGALPTFCPVIVRFVVPEPASSTWNWTWARSIVAARGMATGAKRIPTVWVVDSCTSSRSVLVRLTTPDDDSSASFDPTAIGICSD